jgi:hypothetical protein
MTWPTSTATEQHAEEESRAGGQPCSSDRTSPSTTTVIGQPSRSTLSISTTNAAPRQEPMTRPRPPRIEAPPMITDAMTISSQLTP